MMTLEDIQKGRYDSGAVVYNTNNYRYAIVIDGNRGDDKDPCSVVMEQSMNGSFIVHSPPNRALIPTGRIVDLNAILRMKGCGEENG